MAEILLAVKVFRTWTGFEYDFRVEQLQNDTVVLLVYNKSLFIIQNKVRLKSYTIGTKKELKLRNKEVIYFESFLFCH